MLSRAAASAALRNLGLPTNRVAVHSSMRAIGDMEDGADGLLDVLQETYATLLLPTFCWDSNAPPPGARPERNGCDYDFYDQRDWSSHPWRVEEAGIQPSMGILPRRLLLRPGIHRSDHPWHSWSALGPESLELTEPHPWSTTNLPLERLAVQGGWVVLIGVGLSSCTAIHCAEERAGRKPFIRWATNRQGQVHPVRASGCAKGFNVLLPHCKDLFRIGDLGAACLMAAPLDALIDRAAEIFRNDPSIGVCSDSCLRCRDAVLGGPTA